MTDLEKKPPSWLEILAFVVVFVILFSTLGWFCWGFAR